MIGGDTTVDANIIMQAIGTLGFPIVACCYLAWMHNDSENRHLEERAKLMETIDNNTKSINQIGVILEVIKDYIQREDDGK